MTAGDIAAAGEELERARPLVESAPFPDWIGRFERLQLEFWLAQDRLRAAVDWADQMLRAPAIEERPESEVAHLAMARVLIVKGMRHPLSEHRHCLKRELPYFAGPCWKAQPQEKFLHHLIWLRLCSALQHFKFFAARRRFRLCWQP